jgi:hypothetical protein
MRQRTHYLHTWIWGLLVLLGCVPVAGLAADTAGRYRIVGIGSQSCAKFMDVVRQRDITLKTIEYRSWLEGYLTATNTCLHDTYDILGQHPLSRLLLALDQACQSKAEERIANVVAGVIQRLAPNRTPPAQP